MPSLFLRANFENRRVKTQKFEDTRPRLVIGRPRRQQAIKMPAITRSMTRKAAARTFSSVLHSLITKTVALGATHWEEWDALRIMYAQLHLENEMRKIDIAVLQTRLQILRA